MIIKDFPFFFKSVLLFRAWNETSIVSHNPEFLVTCKWPVDCLGQPTNPNRAHNTIVKFFCVVEFYCTWETFYSLQKSSLQVLFSQSRFKVFASLLQVWIRKTIWWESTTRHPRKFLSSRRGLNAGGYSRKFGIGAGVPPWVLLPDLI